MTRASVLLVTILAGTTVSANPDTGILVMAHGGDPAWNRDVEATVAPLREKYPVEIAYGMARTSTLREAVQRLESRGVERIAVVRMFVSGESFLEPTEYILGLRPALDGARPQPMAGAEHATHDDHAPGPDHAAPTTTMVMEKPEPIDTRATILLSNSGVGESPLIDRILVDRVAALSTDPGRESVLIIAHGPGDDTENEAWLLHMDARAKAIEALGPFRSVDCQTLREDWPHRRAEAEQRITRHVEQASRDGLRMIIVPFRVAGFGPYREVLDGLDYVADGKGFCPHPLMTEWIEQTALACFSDLEFVHDPGL